MVRGRLCHILSFVVGKCFWHFARPAIFDSQLSDQNRDLCLHPTCIRRHPVWYGNTRMVWLPTVKKTRRYVYSFWHDPRTWQTDGRTDTAWRHRPRLCIASRGKNLILPRSDNKNMSPMCRWFLILDNFFGLGIPIPNLCDYRHHHHHHHKRTDNGGVKSEDCKDTTKDERDASHCYRKLSCAIRIWSEASGVASREPSQSTRHDALDCTKKIKRINWQWGRQNTEERYDTIQIRSNQIVHLYGAY